MLSRFRKVDVLVNNAGIQHVRAVDQFSVAKWNRDHRAQLDAASTRPSSRCPHEEEQVSAGSSTSPHARVLVASPQVGLLSRRSTSMRALTKTVALEVAEHGITMNAILPRYVWTPLVESNPRHR